MGSGVGAVLLVLLIGGGLVAGGAVVLRSLLDRGRPGTSAGESPGGSEPAPTGDSAEPTSTSSSSTDDDQESAPSAPSTVVPSTSDPSTSSPSAPTAAAALPDWIGGDWTGGVYQPVGKVHSYDVTVTLAGGTTQGWIEMPDLGCAGVLELVSSDQDEVVMSTRLEEDAWDGCADRSTLRLSRSGSDRLLYDWEDDDREGNVAAATLTRQ